MGKFRERKNKEGGPFRRPHVRNGTRCDGDKDSARRIKGGKLLDAESGTSFDKENGRNGHRSILQRRPRRGNAHRPLTNEEVGKSLNR